MGDPRLTANGYTYGQPLKGGPSRQFHTWTLHHWVDLHAGDAQIIRSGSGLAHKERVVGGARVAMWFDPGVEQR